MAATIRGGKIFSDFMSSANLLKFFRASERDALKAVSFTEAFNDYIDGTMYAGYHQDLLNDYPDAYEYEFSQFLKNYGDDACQVLEPCR